MTRKERNEIVKFAEKLTDEELIKAIECCIKYNCRKCPYILKHIDCVSDKRAEKDFIDLIKRLQTKNDELQKQVDELKQENSILSVTVELQDNAIEQAVKDTAKEIFTDLLKEFSIRKSCGNADVVVREMASRKGVEVE